MRRARGSQTEAPLIPTGPEGHPSTQPLFGRPRTRRPPPAREADPASPSPAGRPAPALALPDSSSPRLPPRALPPTMPGAPLALCSLAPRDTWPGPPPGGSPGPPRPCLQPPGAPSLHAPSSPRLLRRTRVVPEDSLWRAALSGDWPLPRRRESPPHPQVTLCPQAPRRRPPPPILPPTPPAPRPLGPPPPTRPAQFSGFSPPYAGTGLPSGAPLPPVWGAPAREPASGLPLGVWN